MFTILLAIGGALGVGLGLAIALGRAAARGDAWHDEAFAAYLQQVQAGVYARPDATSHTGTPPSSSDPVQVYPLPALSRSGKPFHNREVPV